MDEARALVSDHALWPLVRDFLWDFAPSIHPSWLEGVSSPVDCNRLQSTVIDSPRVKRFILETLEVQPCFHVFPKDDWSRLLLLDGATLLEISKWLGALACADELRRVTSGKTVRELKAALPGVYPEVFGYTEYFKKWKIESVECKIGGMELLLTGRQILFSVLDSLPRALLHRLELKLPKKSSADEDADDGKSQISNIKFQFIALLLKLRFPEAYSLCC